MKTLGIIGAGHLGQQIAHYATFDGHYKSVVFFDDISQEKQIGSYKIIGTSDHVEESFRKNLFDELLIGIGYKHLEARKSIFERFESIPFGKIVHSSVWADPSAIIDPGCVIYPGCVIDAHAKVSGNSVLNVSCTIAHDTVVGLHCFLSPRVAVAGFVTIGELCTIGINATLIDNISIAPGTKVGGGTVVIGSLEKPGLYVGNPHKFVR